VWDAVVKEEDEGGTAELDDDRFLSAAEPPPVVLVLVLVLTLPELERDLFNLGDPLGELFGGFFTMWLPVVEERFARTFTCCVTSPA
jgi:hypothetical protein